MALGHERSYQESCCYAGRVTVGVSVESERPLLHLAKFPPVLTYDYVEGLPNARASGMDIYFSADVETDGSIPGPFSILSFAMVYAGAFDGETFYRPPTYSERFYVELKPISDAFEPAALRVNGLDRDALIREGNDPHDAMDKAAAWVRKVAGDGEPVFVAYPLSFDWSWLYWYFTRFCQSGSPFGYSRCFDVKTAMAVKLGRRIGDAGRQRIPDELKPASLHTHHALDDAIEQAEIFANLFSLGSNE